MKRVLIALVLCLSAAVSAESWTIGQNLQVTPGSDMDVTFQVLAEYNPNENLVHGWKGDELHYVVIVDQQPGGKKPSRYWKGILKEMKKEADDRKIKVLSEGTVTTQDNAEISYKLLSWLSDGETSIKMHNLIVAKKYAYWMLVSPFSDDVDYMVSETKSLLKTTVLAE